MRTNVLNKCSGCFVRLEGDPDPPWYKDLLIGYQDVDDADDGFKRFSGRKMARCTTYNICGSEYLSFLLEQVRMLGGVLVKLKRRVENLSELNSFDVIVNCTGLGSRELANDLNMYASKGLIVSVIAPWIKEWFLESGQSGHHAFGGRELVFFHEERWSVKMRSFLVAATKETRNEKSLIRIKIAYLLFKFFSIVIQKMGQIMGLC